MNPTLAERPAGTAPQPGLTFRVAYRDGRGELHLGGDTTGLAAALADASGTLWLDIENRDHLPLTGPIEAILRDTFGFHPLAVEDAIQETHLPKIDDWGDYVYLVFHGTSIDPHADELRLHELDVFLGPNFLVTYHTEPMVFLEQDRQSIEKDPRDRMRHGTDHLLFRLLERAVDQALAVIEHLDDRVDEVQNRVIEHPRPRDLQTIFRLKRAAIRLHKIFGPQRDVLNKLARDPFRPVKEEHRVYFRDLYDHIVRIHDISESLRDLIGGTLETYLSVVSNRTNDIMKTLTMVTVMFLPMSFIVGFFGMNFFGEPLAFQDPLPRRLLFVGSLAVMCISPTLMWIYARRRRWF